MSAWSSSKHGIKIPSDEIHFQQAKFNIDLLSRVGCGSIFSVYENLNHRSLSIALEFSPPTTAHLLHR
jgi:hypothetical protein